MRRMKKMMGALALALAIVLALSCSNPTQSSGKDDGTKPTPTPPASGVTLYTGTIENYSGNGEVIGILSGGSLISEVLSGNLEYTEYTIGTVRGDAFSFDLKGIPIVASKLLPADFYLDLPALVSAVNGGATVTVLSNTMSVSDPGAKLLNVGVKVKYGEAVELGLVYSNGNYNSSSLLPYYYSWFVYSDRPVTITGSFSYTASYGSDFSMTATVTYAMTLKQGWNIEYVDINLNETDSTTTVTEKVQTTPFAGCAWYVM
jgi:hypothetical protein